MVATQPSLLSSKHDLGALLLDGGSKPHFLSDHNHASWASEKVQSNGIASLLCSSMVHLTAQTMHAINIGSTHMSTCACRRTHTLLGCFGVGLLRSFFVHLTYVARDNMASSLRVAFSWQCLINKSLPLHLFCFLSAQLHQVSLSPPALENVYFKPSLPSGQSASLDDDPANKHEQKNLPNQLRVIQMLLVCKSQLSFLTVSWSVCKGINIWVERMLSLESG